jgi:hypothetical protein
MLVPGTGGGKRFETRSDDSLDHIRRRQLQLLLLWLLLLCPGTGERMSESK